jgi:NAD(P)-dependent dehydrogenase (short-subunit alcohol dehydrogenase family)
MARVQDKVAIVTGGGSGIGRACCLRLAEEGARVVVADISEERGRETVSQVEAGGGEGLFLRHDVTQEAQWESVVARAKETYGGLDVLVNNAGIYLIKALNETTLEEWNNLMAVNVTGVFLGMKRAASFGHDGGGGSIVNMSSVAGLMGVSGHALYGASKGAVRIMTKDVAMEYAASQVRVNSVHPGYINTGWPSTGRRPPGRTSRAWAASTPSDVSASPTTWRTWCSTWPPTRPSTSPAASSSWTAEARRGSSCAGDPGGPAFGPCTTYTLVTRGRGERATGAVTSCPVHDRDPAPTRLRTVPPSLPPRKPASTMTGKEMRKTIAQT